MNSIDLFKYSRFPLSSETLDFLQQMAKLTAKLASMGGVSYILEGCAVAGSNAAAGTVVIDGEILPFAGGPIETYVVIEETKRNVEAEGQVYEEIYVSRVCRFGTGAGQVAWADLHRVPDLFTVAETLDEISTDFDAHILDHRVDWTKVENKPTVFDSLILRTGSVAVGDVQTDKQVTVNFVGVGTTDYIVTGSLRSTGTNWNNDNDVMWTIKNPTANSFLLLCRETSNNTQSLVFDYVIIKKQ